MIKTGNVQKKKDEYVNVQLVPGGKIHRYRRGIRGGTVRHEWEMGVQKEIKIPATKVLFPSCGQRILDDNKKKHRWKIVKGSVTCKHCLMAAGQYSPEQSPDRFTAYDPEKKLFLNKGGWWGATCLSDARLYKAEHYAKARCKRTYYYDADGNEIPSQEYYRLQREYAAERRNQHQRENGPGSPMPYHSMYQGFGGKQEFKIDPKFQVKKVRVMIVEEDDTGE